MTRAAPRHDRSAPRMALLLVLSVLLHLGGLLLWRASPTLPVTSTPLTVRLSSAAGGAVGEVRTVAATPSAAPHSRSPSAPPAVAPAPADAALPPAEAAAQPAPGITLTTLDAPREENSVRLGMGQSVAPAAPDASREAASAQLHAQLRTRFAEHFVYPPLARHHGWEGEVVLLFRVEADGTLSDIQVAQSSGYTLLDNAAVASLRAIERLEFAPGTALRQTLELRMPVVYHLAQG